MKFLMLMWSDVDASGGDQSDIDAWAGFDAAARNAGVFVDGGALQPAASSARLVRTELAGVALDESTADGPFAPGATQIEAFYQLDCADLGEALRWARKLPTYGTVEVRPLLEFDLGRDG